MRFVVFLAIVASFLLAACSSGTKSKGTAGPAPTFSDTAARSLPIFKGDGTVATWSELVASAAAADAVIVGENHGHLAGLASAAALWKDTLAAAPQAVLAMEFFERDEQASLNDYLTGVIDEPALLKTLNRSESNYPGSHRAMVNAAKSASRPVIAANAPRRYVRLARADGFDRLQALTPEQQRLFAIPQVLPQGRYRDDFDKVMNENGGIKPEQLADPAFAAERRSSLDKTFRSQSVWDWTMSQSVVESMQAGRPVLLVVGRFHCDHQGGLVQALRLQRSAARIVVVSYTDAQSPADGKLPSSEVGRADFIVYAGEQPN